MAITISGENNNDRILASDGVLDSISGINAVGVVTATSFTGDLTGDVTGNLTGNVTGNINNSTLLLQTGGTERVRIASNGKVGVGVNPTNYPGKFVVSGDALICDRDIHSRVANSVANSDRGFKQDIDGTEKLHLYADNSSNIILEGNGGSEKLRIDSNGKMGLGTNNPQRLLHLQSTGDTLARITSADGNAAYLELGDVSDPDGGKIVYDSGSNLTFYSASSERLRIKSDGNICIGTQSAAGKLTVDTGSNSTAGYISVTSAGGGRLRLGYAFTGGPSNDHFAEILTDTNGDLDIATRGNNASSMKLFTSTGSGPEERVRIKSNGTVNIGTNNQASGDSSSKLRVGQASGSDVGIVVIGNADTTTPALIITNWDGAQTQNKSVIHFDNSGWGSHQIGSLAGSDGFGIYDDSVLRMSINNVGNTTFHSTGHIVLPSGTTAQRVNSTGAIRFNNNLGNLEFYDGTTWRRVNSTPAAPTSGLLAYWPFSSASRSGSTYNDVSGNGQHLTVNGTILDDTTESKFTDGCIDFGTADGNHYLRSTSNSFADIDSTSGYSGVSVSVWVRTTVTSNQNQWIISEGTVNTRWNYFVENATGPKWRSINGGDIIQSGSMMTGNWHHLVVTWQSSNNLVKHYRDGYFTNQGTTNKTPSFTGNYLLVGQHSSLNGDSSSYRWRGKMAHMRIYNRVLTAGEVLNLYGQWS